MGVGVGVGGWVGGWGDSLNETKLDSGEDNGSAIDATPFDAFHISKSGEMKYSVNVVIAQLNVNSIRNKFDQLVNIIQGNADILVVIETKLDSTFPQFLSGGFSVQYNLDRNSNGGVILVASYHPPSQPDQYFCDNITKILDKYAYSYQKVILGDFNAQDNEIYIRDCIYENNLKNIAKEPACFTNPDMRRFISY